MAFDATPTEVIASWSENGTAVTFNIADVTQLDAAEADATTGDSRRILFALLEQWMDWYEGLATADKPEKLVMTKSVNRQTDGTFRYTYNIICYTDVSGVEVQDEA